MTYNIFDLSGKTALITGASRGIGLAIAKLLSAHGAKTLLVSRKPSDLAAAVHAITDAGGDASAYPCNVSQDADLDRLIAEIRRDVPALNILVNNAATNPFFGPIADASREAWDKTMAVNLRSMYFLSQGLLPLMGPGSSIINVASVNGIRPFPNQSIYSISKAGVLALTKAFSQELAPKGIRVNTLTPGLTDTKMAGAMMNNPSILKGILASVPLGRAALPDEMAGAVLYLASGASSYTTGANLVVDGGVMQQ